MSALSSPLAARVAPPTRLLALPIALVALVVLADAEPVHAQELRLGIDGNYTYNSNFFSNENNPDAANSFQIGPSIALDRSEGRLRYELEFEGAYQIYADQDGVDAWESRLRARVVYDLTTRTRLRITERFRDISNLRFSRQDIELAATALDPNQDRYLRNDLELELIHDLTQLLELRLRGEHHWIDFRENVDRNDSQAFEAAGELRYRVATRHFAGAGLSYTNQEFEEAFERLGSTGEYVNGYLTWTWNVTDAITLTANGGPSWIRSDEDSANDTTQTLFVGGQLGGDTVRAAFASCDVATGPPSPPLPSPVASNCDFTTVAPIAAGDLGAFTRFPLTTGSRVGTDSELTFFGGISLTAALVDWNVDLSYSRRQSTTSGDGLASSLDRIAFEFEYAPARLRWSTFLAGSWDRRETLTDATRIDFSVVNAGGAAQRDVAFTTVQTRRDRRDNFTVIGGIRYRLDRHVSGTLDGRYRRTERRDQLGDRPGVDTFFVVFTVEYDFDPIAL